MLWITDTDGVCVICVYMVVFNVLYIHVCIVDDLLIFLVRPSTMISLGLSMSSDNGTHINSLHAYNFRIYLVVMCDV